MSAVRACDIEAKLASKYLTEQAGWAFLREVTITDHEVMEARKGWDWRNPPPPDDPYWRPSDRRIDALLLRTSGGGKVPFERIAIEIKVSRADFRRDTPEKRAPWMAVAHRFAYATPPGLVSRDEVPEGCGLIEVDPGAPRFQGCTWAKRAPRNFGSPRDFDARFLAYLAGRASRAEYALRMTSPDPSEQLAQGDGGEGT